MTDDTAQGAEPAHGAATLDAWAWVARARAAARRAVEPADGAAGEVTHDAGDGAEAAPG